jgi:hypothetical protein
MATLSKTLKKNKQPQNASAKSLQDSLNMVDDEEGVEAEFVPEEGPVEDFSPDIPTPDADFTLDDMADYASAEELFPEEEAIDTTPGEEFDTGPEESVEPEGVIQGLPKATDRERAYELFDKAKSRNEWLELAQLLAKAATQYGAARAGQRKGVDMSGLNIPGVDYDKRTEGEERMLERRLRDIREEESAQTKAAAAAQAAEDRRLKAALDERRTAAYEKSVGLKGATPRVDPITLAKIKAAIGEEADIAKEKRAEEAAKRTATEVEQRKRNDALDAVITLQGQLLSNTLTPEQQKQAERDMITFSRESGLDISNIYKGATEPGWFTNSVNAKKVLDLFKAEKLRRQQQTGAPAATPATAPAGTSAAAKPPISKSDLQEYAKKYNMSEDEASKFLTGQGYVISQ